MRDRLWGRASSVNVQKVMWALAELGLDHARIDAGGRYGQTDSAEFRALNPNARVPVWQEVEGLVLWESHAILRHLARRGDRLIPGPVGEQWMDWGVGTYYPALIGLFWQVVRTPPAKRSDAKIAAHLEAFESALSILATALDGRDWLDETGFSVADIAIGAGLYRYFDMDIPRAPPPEIVQYYARLACRRAYRTTVMTSYEELRAV